MSFSPTLTPIRSLKRKLHIFEIMLFSIFPKLQKPTNQNDHKFFYYNGEFKILNRKRKIETGKSTLVKNLYENVYKNEKNCFYYENMKFFIIFKKLSQHMILVNKKSTLGQLKKISSKRRN